MEGENVGSWDRLPVTALEKIFSYLNPIDKSQAACVCKSWNEAYSTPSFWTAPVFKFNKPQTRMPRFNPRSIVQKYGSFFRKLTIICKRRPGIKKKFLEKQISVFLEEMTQHGVQLQSFRMPKWCVINKYLVEDLLSKKLAEFLKNQNALNNVDFSNARALSMGGITVLESLRPDNVEHLHLKNFFVKDNVLFGSDSRFLDAMIRLHGLRTLSINYKYLSVRFLSALAGNVNLRLELLSIHCVFCGSIDYIIPENSWSELMGACPAMKVNFSIETDRAMMADVVRRNVISRFMRLEGFEFRNRFKWHVSDYDIFDYVSRTFSSTLKNVELNLRGYSGLRVTEGALNFVSRCGFLEKFTLRAQFRIFNYIDLLREVHELLVYQLHQNMPISLKEFRFTIRNLEAHERAFTVNIRQLYKPHFQMLGLKFYFIVQP